MKNVKQEFIENVVYQIQSLYDNNKLDDYDFDIDVTATFEDMYGEIEEKGNYIKLQEKLNMIYNELPDTTGIVDEYAWGYNNAILDFDLLK